MVPRGVRYAAIVAALAAIVAFVPHGGSSAGALGGILQAVLSVLFVLFAAQLYMRFRTDIYGLGEGYRAILYGSIGLFVLAMAGRTRLADTGPGTLLLIVMIGAALGGLVACFTRWRAERF
jgi:hypothetical protein